MTVIAMTREIGSLGTDVAAGVAAELGLEIINSEIVVSVFLGPLADRYEEVIATYFGSNSQSGSER